MSPTWATFLFETANFLLLAALLGWLFFRPVRGAIDRRRAELEAERREADERGREAERQLAEARKLRAELDESLAGLRARALEEAGREAARVLDAARERAQREREALESELAALRRAQTRARSLDSVRAAREVVVRLLERIGGPDVDRALLDAARREIGTLARGGRLEPVIVEVPGPLGTEALAALAESAGVAPGQLEERVVPELVAGIRILTARGLVDASARGLSEQAERALVARIDAEDSADG